MADQDDILQLIEDDVATGTAELGAALEGRGHRRRSGGA